MAAPTSTGTSRLFVSPCPSWPLAPQPKVQSLPASVITIVRKPPHDTIVTADPPTPRQTPPSQLLQHCPVLPITMSQLAVFSTALGQQLPLRRARRRVQVPSRNHHDAGALQQLCGWSLLCHGTAEKMGGMTSPPALTPVSAPAGARDRRYRAASALHARRQARTAMPCCHYDRVPVADTRSASCC